MKMIDLYSAKAMQLLGKAKTKEYFSKEINRQRINDDEDLDSLRDRDDFKQFRKELEASASEPDEK